MSVQFIDPWKFLYELNEYRIRNKLAYVRVSKFLSDLTKKHCKDIIESVVPFGLENQEIRKRKISSCAKNSQEILARVSEDKSLLESILQEPNTKKIIDKPFNLCGVTIYEIGTTTYMHLILAET